jgi:hypothetical protein
MRAFIFIGMLLLIGAGRTFAGQPELSSKEVLDAKKLYVAKCAKCHKFYEPKGYSDPAWQKWMDSMSRKSKLKPEQEKLLKSYLDAYRSGEVTAAK